MPRLSEIQAAFQRYVLTQDPAIAAHIASNERFGRDQRLAVYANAYRARLVEALASDYQAVQRSLGEEAFTRLCHAYIRAHSSTSYSLRWFGEQLPAFLRQDYPEHLSELARFEWALTTSFDADDADLALVQAATAIPPEGWPTVRIRMHPSVSWLRLVWNTLARFRTLKEGCSVSLPERLIESTTCLIWRDGLATRYRSIDRDESAALHAAGSGATFAELCEQLTSWGTQAQVALRAASLLKTWLASGMVSELIL